MCASDDRRRLRREQPQRRFASFSGLLRREPPLGPRGASGAGPEPEEAVALGRRAARRASRRASFVAPVLGEPARQLLGRLLGLELDELGLLVREEPARLQLEQRRDEDEELAAGVEVELVALGEALDEREHDPGDVDLAQGRARP